MSKLGQAALFDPTIGYQPSGRTRRRFWRRLPPAAAPPAVAEVQGVRGERSLPLPASVFNTESAGLSPIIMQIPA